MEAKTTILAIKKITANSLNPRKHFNEDALNELADSIKSVGLIQPITVRPKGKGYEVVCGERRWRASKIAGLKDISAIIRVLTDDEVMDIAITENLQRKDITPLEESEAICYLQKRGASINDIALKLGKSEKFVRSRIKLASLIEEIKDLLAADKLTISQSIELAKFSEDIQKSVYKEHLSDDANSWYGWRDKRADELLESIEDSYTSELEKYSFDKTECGACPNNSTNYSLFGLDGDSGWCANSACLQAKNRVYFTDTLEQLLKLRPTAVIWSNDMRGHITKSIISSGHEVVEGYYHKLTSIPKEPDAKLSDDIVEYSKAVDIYNAKLKDYRAKLNSDKYRPVIYISGFIELCCLDIAKNPDAVSKTPEEQKSDVVVELQNKLKRFNEIRIEKSWEDTRKLISGTKKVFPMSEVTTDLDEQFMYYQMLDCRDKEILNGKYMDNQGRFALCATLTYQQKVLIMRKWIYKQMTAYDHFDQAQNVEFIKQFHGAKVSEIELKHQETYLKRKEKIDAQIADIEMSNK